MLKSATNAVTCSQKNFVSYHKSRAPCSSTWIGVWYAGTTTQVRKGPAQTSSTPITTQALRILGEKKKPVSDGRVLIDLNSYQSLDEDQREMLKEHGLVVDIVNSQ